VLKKSCYSTRMSLYQKIGKGGVNDLKKYLRKNPLTINSWVTRLHSVLTVGLLGASTVILTLNSYVGEPIQCESGAESADKTHGNTFCWIYGPKTKDHTDGSCDHNHVFDLSQKDAEGWSVRSHQFYQWINLTLIMQALFFYLPGWMWAEMEGGEVEGVVGEKGLRPLGDVMTRPKEEVKKEAVKVAKKLLELQESLYFQNLDRKLLFCLIILYHLCLIFFFSLFVFHFQMFRARTGRGRQDLLPVNFSPCSTLLHSFSSQIISSAEGSSLLASIC